MEESQTVDTEAGQWRQGWPIGSRNKPQPTGQWEFEEDHAASFENIQNEDEALQDGQLVEEESNETFTQPPKRRRQQQHVKSTAHATNKGFNNRIRRLENLMLEVTSMLPPRQPQVQHEGPS